MSVQIGFGAYMSVNDGASNAQTAFNNVLTVMLPKREFGEFEATQLKQVDGSNNPIRDRYFRATLRDNGTITVEGYFDQAEQARWVALHGKNDKEFELYSPDPDGTGTERGLKATFKGFVKTIGEVKFERDKESMQSVEIRISGPVTLAQASNATVNEPNASP